MGEGSISPKLNPCPSVFICGSFLCVPRVRLRRMSGLQSFSAGSIVNGTGMKPRAKRSTGRMELGRYIVADPEICHGQPTFKGTRILVQTVLDQAARGMSWEAISAEWRGRVTSGAIEEALRLAGRAFADHATEYAEDVAA